MDACSLKAVGGTAGVGVTFLEETFSASSAPPEHRYHQKAARANLKALLPETGSDIKGHMRSYAELLEASGYGSRPRDFDDLIRILDSEIRLITPTDPEGKEGAEESSSQAQPGQKYYQLTHDYLVHSLREWLTRKQKETRRGRAELLLADRAGVWSMRPENRQLPSLLQWFQIQWLTKKKSWTPPQRKMMRKATHYHAVRGLLVAVLLAVLGWGGYEGYGRLQANALRDRLLDANTNEVPAIVQDMRSYRPWLNPLLHEAHGKAEAARDARKQLHASLALLPVDATQVDYLSGRLLEAAPHEVPVVRDALAPHKDELLDKLWAVLENPEKGKESQRLRAAAALAKYDPESEKWATVQEAVGNDLVNVSSVYLPAWLDSLRPVRAKLMPHLSAVYRDAKRGEAERSLATDILADYSADETHVLAELLMDADKKQFTVIYPKFKDRGEQGLPVLLGEIDRKLPPVLPVTTDWTVRFYKWEKVGPTGAPADWEAVVKAPLLDELRVPRLRFHGTRESLTGPTKKVPHDHFAVVASTDVLLGDGDYLLTTTFDDGIRVWLDGTVVFENWTANFPTSVGVTIGGQRGRHVLKVEYFQRDLSYALDVELKSSDDGKDKLAKRQANAAVALLRMKQPERVWPLLKHSDDPRARSYLIHRLSPLGADARAIVSQLDAEKDVAIQRALLLSLGEYGEQDFTQEEREALLPKLHNMYRTAPDPGLHAAAEWLLRTWKKEAWLKQEKEKWAKDKERREKRLDDLKQLLAKDKEKTPPQWYVNGQGQTLVVVPGPVEFAMGSPLTEVGRQDVEVQHKRRIGRTFALAANSVTVEQYRQFDKGYQLPALYNRTADLPVVGINWYMAAAYCNWLSKEEGIDKEQWCYETNLLGQLTKLKANYLSLTGYRLPTEAEMEYATRAGALTSRYFGETEELLPKYAWYNKNSQEKTWPVGSLKPNDLGLFDVQGNVFTWCQESFKAYPVGKGDEAAEDQEDGLMINSTGSRVLRGGSFGVQASNVRSANRNLTVPVSRNFVNGFRPARTFTP